MLSASDELRAAIDAAGGAVRFDEYMRIALYGAAGFYTAGGHAGRRGDFLTAPEVGPLFGAVMARWIESEWRRLGEPPDFVIVECGAGRGSLARSILAAAPRWRGRYTAVEVSAQQRAQHPDGVCSTAEMPAEIPFGVIIANELLDNLPFRLVVGDGEWREVAVTTAGDRFVEVTVPADPSWGWLPTPAPHGARLPVQESAAQWVNEATSRLSRGTVICLDYCTARTAQLVGRPWREWLRTYRRQSRGGHYLDEPGSQDITAEVCLDQLPPATTTSQSDFLRGRGIDTLVEEGRAAWTAAAASPDLHALAMRSRVREAEALLDPSGLGAFTVLQWTGGRQRQLRRVGDQRFR